MTQMSLEELKQQAAQVSEPTLVPILKVNTGGVDPLGLRQTNFELMDRVFPGVNNVGRHIRPFVVVAWAWRRAIQVARRSGASELPISMLRDFVDRIETIYVWSQFMLDSNADLPGGDLLRPKVGIPSWRFGGADWEKFRDTRETSTGLTAPITYGPALKMLGWIVPHEGWPDMMAPAAEVEPALDAFEKCFQQHLELPLFNRLGDLEVDAGDVRKVASAWSLLHPTPEEKRVARDLIFGVRAAVSRRQASTAMVEAVRHTASTKTETIRQTMAGRPSNFVASADGAPAVEAWRLLQNRQLFRLTLEAMFYWTTLNLSADPRTVESLGDQFVKEVGESVETVGEWTSALARAGAGDPVGVLEQLSQILDAGDRTGLARAVAIGLCVALAEAPADASNERGDRLPLATARKQVDERASASPRELLNFILESWIFAQHTYWAVGRGLADARTRGKTLLRLKVMLEEGGWVSALGLTANRPSATPDRLETMLSLAGECGLLDPLPEA